MSWMSLFANTLDRLIENGWEVRMHASKDTLALHAERDDKWELGLSSVEGVDKAWLRNVRTNKLISLNSSYHLERLAAQDSEGIARIAEKIGKEKA